MSQQRGTPTVIRHRRIGDDVGMVITVSTPTAFTAHFHVYRVGSWNGPTYLNESFGYWPEEKGAVDAFDQWVEDNSPAVQGEL